MLVLLRKFIRLLSANLVLRKILRTIAKKCISTQNSFLNYAGWGMAGNISLADINTFTIQASNKKDIIYSFCPQESWVLKGLFWSGKPNFEKDTADIFFERALNARTILDIGANLGYYTYLAATANAKARVIAFEPIKYLAEKIQDNSLLNGFAQVTVIDQAVSDKKGEATFYINVKSPTMSTLSPEDAKDSSNYEKKIVLLVKLDDYVEENNVTDIDLIKIDVEEHEPEALEGMLTLLERDKPDVICEILPVTDKAKKEKRDRIQKIFNSRSYKWYWISPNGLVEEKEIIGHQVFNANYLFTARN